MWIVNKKILNFYVYFSYHTILRKQKHPAVFRQDALYMQMDQTPLNPLPMISLVLVMNIKALLSTDFTNWRS